MKKIKQWVKDHKKEIIVGAVTAGGTTLYFLSKKKKIEGIKCGLRLSFELLNGEKDEDYYGFRSNTKLYTSLNLHQPSYTVEDLGKIGIELMNKIPSLTKDVKIENLNANYTIIKK